MLEAVQGKSRRIEKTEKEKNCLFLIQESGIIRIWPQTASVIRISYTESGCFTKAQGAEYADISYDCLWDYQETQEEIQVDTEALTIYICKETGSILYKDKSGKLLFTEAKENSKTVEKFDSYHIADGQHVKTQDIQTPDGIKKKILAADKIYDKTLYHTRLSIRFQDKERLFGLGQAPEGTWNLRHTTQYLHQANRKIAIPLLLSTAGYGILLSTQSTAIFNDTQYGSYLYTEADHYLDYYFMAGTCMDAIIHAFRQLTGKAVMLPRWMLGYIQSQERYESAKELIDTVSEFRRRNLGLDTIVLDWMSWPGNLWGQKKFDSQRFPDPAGMIAQLHEQQVHFMLSVWPVMSEETEDYRAFAKEGKLLPGTGIYDAFDADARALYWKQVRDNLYDKGIDAWWCDSSEPVTPEWERKVSPEASEMYHNYVENAENCMPAEKMNAFGLYHARTIYEGQRGEGPDKRVTNLTRSGYPGSQKYGVILWSGDIAASWDTLRRQIAAGLQLCASGMPYWTLDIGGFFVKNGDSWFWNGSYDSTLQDDRYRELYVRWFQYGAFLPVFRSHGTDCRREPWQFGEQGDPYYGALREAIAGRYRLMPYLYSLMAQVWMNDSTMMRMLAFDFPEDEQAVDTTDEYMLGPYMLICPVIQQMGKGVQESERSVYLPSGTDWYDYVTHERYEGGQILYVRVKLDHIPVYVKAGAVIPVTEPAGSTLQQSGQPITIEVYAGADGNFTLYEDAGDGYEYENGAYALTHITYRDTTREVSWKTDGAVVYQKGIIKTVLIE